MIFGIIGQFIAWIKRLFSLFRKKKGLKVVAIQSVEEDEAIKNLEQEKRILQQEPLEMKRKSKLGGRAPRKERRAGRRKIRRSSHAKTKIIDLGKRTVIGARPSSSLPEATQKEKRMVSGISDRIAAPFIELDINKARVFLVIPRQEFPTEKISEGQLEYQIGMSNGFVKRDVLSFTKKDKCLETKEQKIEIEYPLRSLKVIFPLKFGNRVYLYEHYDDSIYIFTERGERGRMYYLYDLKKKINYLPQREVWILLREDFELNNEPDLIGETWIWERYRLLRINLKNTEKLILSNKITSERKIILCKPDFSLFSENVIYDCFGEQFPIFTSMPIKIRAPTENEEGWMIWIQNEQTGSGIIVSDKWSGKEPFRVDLSKNSLFCECGEFRIDISGQNEETVTTLFFRYIPSLELKYPKELIIPDSERGHGVSEVEVLLADAESWEIKSPQQIWPIPRGYKIALPPEEDVLEFSIFKKSKPETKTDIKIALPRLKWKISRQGLWMDKPICLKREELVSSEDLVLFINTNGLTNCDFRVTLEMKNHQLQEAIPIRKGSEYAIKLNDFFDSIKENKDKLTLKLETLYPERRKIDIIYFPPDYISLKEAISLLRSLGLIDRNFTGDNLETNYEQIKEILRRKAEELRDLCICIVEKSKSDECDKLLREAQKEREQNDLIDEIRYYIKTLESFKNEMKKEINSLYDKIKTIEKTKKEKDYLIKQLENDLKNLERIYFINPFQKKNVDDFYKNKMKIECIVEEIDKIDEFLYLFISDISKPGNITYLVEKWKYFKEKDGSLSKMMVDDGFDEKYVFGPLKENDKIRKTILEFYVPKSLNDINLDYRLEHMDFLSIEDRRFAKLDAKNFFDKLLKMKKEMQKS
ncbi:MAG: hypothetical protein QW279_07805 [Candidatus Jordarchaeaceae archaeon]